MSMKSSARLLLMAILASLAILVGLSIFPAELLAQSGRPDDRVPAPTRPSPPKPGTNNKPNRPRPEPQTTLTITVNPSDSTVQVNNVVAGQADANGSVIVRNLKTTVPHFVVVRRAGFRDHAQTIELKRGVNNEISIVLEPVPGLLNVATSDAETLVVVRQAGSLREVGRNTGTVAEMQLAPGDYVVQTSRPGFKTAERSVSIRAGHSVYLEPKLEQIEIPKPAPPRPRVATVPMSWGVRVVDKYYLITLEGASGTADRSGTVDIISSRSDVNLEGSLSGLPCAVDLIRVENAAEASLVEVPSPANRWSRAVLRVKPKDQKLLIHVALNWRAIDQETLLRPQDSFTQPVAIYKALPVFPAAARTANVDGRVVVEITIDIRGDVIAARAISGPSLLRTAAEEAARKWKFRPATRNGAPMQTSQTIVFNFQK